MTYVTKKIFQAESIVLEISAFNQTLQAYSITTDTCICALVLHDHSLEIEINAYRLLSLFIVIK